MKLTRHVIISIIVISLLITTFIVIYPTDEDENEKPPESKWHIYSGWDGNYQIIYQQGPSVYINDISFNLVDQSGMTVIQVDDNGNEISINGTLAEILVNSSKRIDAFKYGKATGWRRAYFDSRFYADYPEGIDNRSLYILYYDGNDDYKLTKEKRVHEYDDVYSWSLDGFAIRSILNGGPGGPDCQLILSDRTDGEIIDIIQLPSPRIPFNCTSELINGNFRITIHEVNTTPFNDISYWYMDPNKIPYHLPDDNTIDFRGEIKEIIWDETKYLLAKNSTWPSPTIDELFYADYPSGTNNRTLYMIVVDNDNDDNLSNGDIIYCRGKQNGGFGTNKSEFRLYYERLNKYQIYAPIYHGFLEHFDDHLDWNLTVVNETYVVEITDVQPRDWHDIDFSIVDDQDNLLDVSGEYRNQSLDSFYSIAFDQAQYDYAVSNSDLSTHGPYFYSTYSDNITLFIVFMDANDNGDVDPGDKIYIRSATQGGLIEEGYKLRIYERWLDRIYETITFPTLS